MARKRKSRNNSKIGHGAISRIGRPNNPFEPRRNRYAQKYLTLALMGGAAFFVLKGCSDSSDVDNDGCIDSLEVRKKPGGHWIIRDLAGLDLVGLASL